MNDPALMLGIVLGEMSKTWPIGYWSWPDGLSGMGGPYVVDITMVDGSEYRLTIQDKALIRD